MKREIITRRDIEKQIRDIETAQPYLEDSTDSNTARNLIPKQDDYQSKLLKYIPTEVVALYITLDGIVKAAFNPQLSQEYWLWLWIIFAILLISTPLYLWRVTKVRKKKQLVISTVALVVWVFALGGAFVAFRWYKPFYGAIILPLYTFFIPILEAD
ncbi:hypothetical protein I8751_11940 [Nostocaceae cyanobacterium CENA357]|uniref:Uncharacterized protein n=1 Tax=Atlanticothrix silvestris CENA357 TaxID=1725252 RepID=A0A8J7HD70_9CYAN|nr:hypothetical protein [Atlanticothrix silvestris]MBH8553064.1 hypothetical protein [Atlanticothrix silvestris CENA357]